MFKKGLIVVAIIGVVGLIAGWKHVNAFMNGRTKTTNSKTIYFAIDNSKTIAQIASDLKQKNAIDDSESFVELAEYKNLTNSKIGSGMYRIESGTNFRTLLNGFTLNSSGNGNAEVEVEVTFNNCKTIHDMCEKIGKCLAINPDQLEKTIYDSKTLSKYDFSVESIPALFLPNSYKMFYDTDENQFIARMAEEFKRFWTAERLSKLKSIGLKSPSQAVTLASIVYGEQSVNKIEWPIIAGLYLNRLNTGMKLQSDPTFKFCWGDELDGVQRLTFEHRSKDCPYNTYIYSGLPPGPISMPPTGVVDAVLNRDKNNYLYMCAQPNYDGLHNFAKDYSVHAKYAQKFQRWLASEINE